MAPRTLYQLTLDPGCREVRLVLGEKRLVCDLADPHTHDGHMEVPQLHDETGISLPYASVIGEYLEEAYPEITLLGEDTLKRAEVRRLWRLFSGEMGERITRPILFEKVYKQMSGQGGPDSQVLIRASQAKNYFLEEITNLYHQRHWLAGSHYSFADVAAAAQISILDYLKMIDWRAFPVVRDWYALVKSRPSMASILADRVQGFPPPPHYSDPDF